MEFEIVAFYETHRDDKKALLSGTLHIRLPELGIELRGIRVQKKKDFFRVALPHGKAVSDGKDVFYPCITFTDREKTKAFLEELRLMAIEYIQENVLNGVFPR